MKAKLLFPQIVAAAVALLLLGGLGAYWPTWVGADTAASTLGPQATIGDAITYQGYLTDENGVPLNGTFPMRFEIYNAQTGGSLLWDSGTLNVVVKEGLFEVRLGIDTDIFNGEELWVAQTISGELLTPRQEILPAPMAHTLRPGAVVKATASGFSNNYTLEVHLNNDAFAFNRGAIAGQTTTGNAIYGLANNGRAVYGQTQDGYAVYGFDGGSEANRGYGGYFYSTNGIGIYGYSGANRSHPNILAPGVYGQSNQGVGVYGRGDTSNSHTFFNQGGYFEGGKGLYALGTDSAAQLGYGAQIYSSQYRGCTYRSFSGQYDAYFGGTGGISVDHVDVRSAPRTIVINVGSEAIAPGDLVAMAGVGTSPLNGEPMLAVAKLDASNAKAVIGVAAVAMSFDHVPTAEGGLLGDLSPAVGPAARDGYLAIITEGLAPAVNLSSATHRVSWEIGDKIAIAASGDLGRVQSAADDIVIGKVAGPIDAASGTIPLFIDID